MTDDTDHLRDLLADEHAKRCAAELDHAGAEADLAEWKTRAEKAEAACAEIRAALEHWTHVYGAALKPPGADTYGEGMRDAKDQVRALLSRPDLGAGKVLVEREVVERAYKQLKAGMNFLPVRYQEAVRQIVADLDALLKEGGG